MDKEFIVGLKTLLDNKLSFEAYFILWCVRYKDKKLLLDYVEKCGKIKNEHFERLEGSKLLYINRSRLIDGNITFESLSLTAQSSKLLNIDTSIELFEEFKQYYPQTVGDKYSRRRLHTDQKRCKLLYSKIVNGDIEMHKMLCKAADMYHNEKKRSNSLTFMQAMPAWLFQENYEPYLEEIKKGEITLDEQTNVEGI